MAEGGDGAGGIEVYRGYWWPKARVRALLYVLGLAIGIVLTLIGAASWHTVATRNHTAAKVDREFGCYRGNSDTTSGETFCNYRVVFYVGNRLIHAVVTNVDRSNVYGPPGDRQLEIFYNPAGPFNPGSTDDSGPVAKDLFAMGLVTLSGTGIAFLFQRRTSRRRIHKTEEPFGPGPAQVPELDGSLEPLH